MKRRYQRYTETKVCPSCNEARSLGYFALKKNGIDRHWKCAKCFTKSYRNSQWRHAGIKDFDRPKYAAMLEAQGHRCAICRKADDYQSLSVDHEHDTGKVRGLLCNYCNRGMGFFKDDASLLAAAVLYLETHSALPQLVSTEMDVCPPSGDGGAVGEGHYAWFRAS